MLTIPYIDKSPSIPLQSIAPCLDCDLALWMFGWGHDRRGPRLPTKIIWEWKAGMMFRWYLFWCFLDYRYLIPYNYNQLKSQVFTKGFNPGFGLKERWPEGSHVLVVSRCSFNVSFLLLTVPGRSQCITLKHHRSQQQHIHRLETIKRTSLHAWCTLISCFYLCWFLFQPCSLTWRMWNFLQFSIVF